MKRLMPFFLLLLIVFKAHSIVAPGFEKNQIFVKIKDSCLQQFPLFDSIPPGFDTTQMVINGINFNYFKIHGIEKTFKILGLTHYKLSTIYTFSFADSLQVEALIDSLEKIPCVEYAEKIPEKQKFYQPSDMAAQTGTNNQWELYKIKAMEAWDIHRPTGTGKEIKIAVVDDAVWSSHPELSGVIWTNPGEAGTDAWGNDKQTNGLDDDGNGYTDDVHGWDVADWDNDANPPPNVPSAKFEHGTMVASIAGAQTDVGTPGMASLGFNVKIIPVKTGLAVNNNTDSRLVNDYDGVEYAIAAKADIINMSWGSTDFSATEEIIMQTAHEAGIVLVASAGNNAIEQKYYPASYNHVISVGATNVNDKIGWFSNYNTSIDVMAPGEDVLVGLYHNTSSTRYIKSNGTSLAGPMVASLCALMLSYDPTLTPDGIETCLKNGCDDITAQNLNTDGEFLFEGKIGAGRINAKKTLECMQRPPEFEFSSNFQTVCRTKSVRFSCKFTASHGTTYNWIFPGGTPSTSTLPNPVVTYNTSGLYAVHLSVSNDFGTTGMSIDNYINVKESSGNYNYTPNADNNWQFYNGQSLKFEKNSTADPVLKRGGKIILLGSSASEACASISNGDGQLLFYTNAYEVYNRHHQLMQNGSDLGAGTSVGHLLSLTQGAIIVPSPAECSSIYYLFHLGTNRLFYSVIDMDADNGLGAVIEKNVALGPELNLTEKLIAIMHCNGRDVWVIVHEKGNNRFKAYLVTPEGVDKNPVISDVGEPHHHIMGQMKGSPDGTKIATAMEQYSPGINQLFDFDKKTGLISNPVTFYVPSNADGANYQGVEFSSDGTKVYFAGDGLWQYDLSSFTSTTPRTIILDRSQPQNLAFEGFLELGPDGKIYASKMSSSKEVFKTLDVITAPNEIGTVSNAIRNHVPIQNAGEKDRIFWGLNNAFISKTLNYRKEIQKKATVYTLCSGVTLKLEAGAGKIYEWSNGETTPNIMVNTPGEYSVVVTDEVGCKTMLAMRVEAEPLTLDLPNEVTFTCSMEEPVILDAGEGFAGYKWPDGSTGRTFTVTHPGIFSVEVITPRNCVLKDKVKVSVPGGPEIPETVFTCGSEPVDLTNLVTYPCTADPNGSVDDWKNSVNGLPVGTMPFTPAEDESFYREYKDQSGCVICIEHVDIRFERATFSASTTQLACQNPTVVMIPYLDPPCGSATSWDYYMPGATYKGLTAPAAYQADAVHGDEYKVVSYLPNGCTCENTLKVIGSPTVIKKKTIYINCGQSIDLESYNTNYCGGSQFFWSTEPFSANVTLPYNVSPKNNTTYLRYNYNQYCVECIFELSVVVRRPAPKAIEIGIECGQRVNLELISGCSGFEYDWYKENPGGQPIIVVGPSVEPTETGIYYRESKGDCPCKARIKVNVLTPELRTVIISPEQYSCNARPYRFTQGCPTGAGYKQSDLYGPDRYLFFLPILVPLEHLGWSNVSYEDYNIYIPGEYLMVAEYYNGCKCTTKYIVNTLEPPKKYIPIISLCENKSFKPADCSGATTYKWFDWAFTNSIVTDGSITLAQRDDIAAPNNGQYLWRVGYDQFGCIVCVDKFVIGNDTYGYTRIDYKYHNTIEACDGEVIHLDIKKFFTPPFNCSLTLNGTPPPTQQISSIVTSPNGDITIQVNQLTQNISLEFECPGQGDQCPTRVYVDIKKKENCPSGMAAPPNETSIQSEGKKITSLKVYPNPTTSSVKIEMPMFLGISTVKLYDALGRQIFVTETKDSELQLDLSDFSKGIYMLLVENNGVVYTEKVAFE